MFSVKRQESKEDIFELLNVDPHLLTFINYCGYFIFPSIFNRHDIIFHNIFHQIILFHFNSI